MKNILFSVFLLTFIVVGISDQAWAMGKRRSSSGHHSSSNSNSNDSSQSNGNGGSSSQNSGSGQNQGSNHDDNSNSDEEFTPSFYSEDSGDERFPAATPVPEPATLSLVGMGLAAVLLKYRKQ